MNSQIRAWPSAAACLSTARTSAVAMPRRRQAGSTSTEASQGVRSGREGRSSVSSVAVPTGRPYVQEGAEGGRAVFLDTGAGKGGHLSWIDLRW